MTEVPPDKTFMSENSSALAISNPPPPHNHPTHKDSDSLFFASNARITEIRMLTKVVEFCWQLSFNYLC